MFQGDTTMPPLESRSTPHFMNAYHMMCEHCVARITEALKAKDLKFTVDLAGKTVSIDGCEHCAATAIHELEDLGFTPSLQ